MIESATQIRSTTMKIHAAWLQIYNIVGKNIPHLKDRSSQLFAQQQSLIENELIDYTHFHNGFVELKNLSNRQDFAWFIGSKIPSYGVIPSLRSYFASCATLGECSSEALRLQAIAFPGCFTFGFELIDENVEFCLKPVDPNLQNLSCVVELIMSICNMACKNMVSEDFEYSKVMIAEADYDQSLLRQYSQAELITKSPKMAVQYHQSWLVKPQRYASAELVNVLKPIVEKENARIIPKKDLPELIENYLKSCEIPRQAKLSNFASALDRSEVTIRRRLSDLGLNFSDILQSYLQTECMRYLLDPKESIESIALRLGYSERAALERAFKRWYGKTPSQFREEYRATLSVLDTEDSYGRLSFNIMENNHTETLRLIEEQADIEDIAQSIKPDLVLSAKIIGAANSAYFGTKSVHDLQSAIGKVLGLSRVKGMIVVNSLNTLYQQRMNKDYDLRKLLLVSILSEEFCRKLTAEKAFSSSSSKADFINAAQFGLLGQILLASGALAHQDTWVKVCQTSENLDEILEWEKQHYAINTYSVSNVLLNHWGMSPAICKLLDPVADANSKQKNPAAPALRAIHNYFWCSCSNNETKLDTPKSIAEGTSITVQVVSDLLQQIHDKLDYIETWVAALLSESTPA